MADPRTKETKADRRQRKLEAYRKRMEAQGVEIAPGEQKENEGGFNNFKQWREHFIEMDKDTFLELMFECLEKYGCTIEWEKEFDLVVMCMMTQHPEYIFPHGTNPRDYIRYFIPMHGINKPLDMIDTLRKYQQGYINSVGASENDYKHNHTRTAHYANQIWSKAHPNQSGANPSNPKYFQYPGQMGEYHPQKFSNNSERLLKLWQSLSSGKKPTRVTTEEGKVMLLFL